MNTRQGRFVLAVLAILAGGGPLQAAQPPGATAMASRLGDLEDREAIRLVLRDYGRLLDERKFDDFGQLFAPDGEYVSAGRTTLAGGLFPNTPDEMAVFLRTNFLTPAVVARRRVGRGAEGGAASERNALVRSASGRMA